MSREECWMAGRGSCGLDLGLEHALKGTTNLGYVNFDLNANMAVSRTCQATGFSFAFEHKFNTSAESTMRGFWTRIRIGAQRAREELQKRDSRLPTLPRKTPRRVLTSIPSRVTGLLPAVLRPYE